MHWQIYFMSGEKQAKEAYNRIIKMMHVVNGFKTRAHGDTMASDYIILGPIELTWLISQAIWFYD